MTVKRILQVTARYRPYVGGIETHVDEVSRRLAANGHAVTVLTADPTRAMPANERYQGVDIRRVPAYPANRDYYLAPAIGRAVRDGGWDVVHIQGCHTLVPPLAMVAARRAGLPYVLTFHTGGHSSRLRQSVRSLQWRLLRPLLAGAYRLIGVSRFEARSFRDRLGLPAEQFAVIPNGAELPVASTHQASKTTILSIGRLERYKGHQRVIAAMPHVLTQRPDARLVIVGKGPYEAALHYEAERHGVDRSVDFRSVPAGDRQAMADLVGTAALVTLLSDYEAHPIAVLEALALRRPVLVADSSGLAEIAEDGHATAVPLDATPRTVATAILDQLARPHVAANVSLPTWDGCIQALERVYSEAGVACVS